MLGLAAAPEIVIAVPSEMPVLSSLRSGSLPP